MIEPSESRNIVSVDLGDMAEGARARVASGEFDSLDTLMQAAVLALSLDKDWPMDSGLETWIARRSAELDAGDGRNYTAREAFARIDAHIARRRRERDAA